MTSSDDLYSSRLNWQCRRNVGTLCRLWAATGARRILSAELARTIASSRISIKLNHIFEEVSMLSTIVLIILLLALVGTLPAWPHAKNWGYAPSGLLGTLLVVVLLLAVLGRV